MLDLMWEHLQDQLNAIRAEAQTAITRSERAETAGALRASTLANAPLAAGGAAAGMVLWITNGRKTGEGVGAGTGVPAYYQASSNTWKRFEDNADVVV